LELIHQLGRPFTVDDSSLKVQVVSTKGKAPVNLVYQKRMWTEFLKPSSKNARKSTFQGICEIQLPQMTLWCVLWKRLSMKYYKLQLLQALKPDDKVKQYELGMQMQADMEDDKFATCLIFSDEETFHLSGEVKILMPP
jgi:hypothetical protein